MEPSDVDAVLSTFPIVLLFNLSGGEACGVDDCAACDVIHDYMETHMLPSSMTQHMMNLIDWHMMGCAMGEGIECYLRCIYIYEAATNELSSRA